MNKLLFLALFIFSSISLHAYSKHIVLATMSNKDRAAGMIKRIPKKSPSVYKLAKKYNISFYVEKSNKFYLVVAGVFHKREEILKALKEVRKSYPGSYPALAKTVKQDTVVKKEAVVKVEPTMVEVVDEKISKIVLKKPNVQEKTTVPKAEVKDTVAVVAEEINTEVKEVVAVVIEEPKAQIKDTVAVVAEKPKAEVKDVAPEAKVEKKKVEPKAEEVESESFFSWWYIILLIVFGVLTYYFIKFKKIYDEY